MLKKNSAYLVLLTAGLTMLALSGCGNDISVTADPGSNTNNTGGGGGATTQRLDDFQNSSTGCLWCDSSGYLNTHQAMNGATVGSSFSSAITTGLPTGVSVYRNVSATASAQYQGVWSVFLPYGYDPTTHSYDLTVGGTYNAISFYIKGNGQGTHVIGGGHVEVNLIVANTASRAKTDCALNTGYMYAGYLADITSQVSSSWVKVTIPFSSIAPNPYACSGLSSTFDATGVVSIGFQVQVVDAIASGTVAASIDLADLELIHQ